MCFLLGWDVSASFLHENEIQQMQMMLGAHLARPTLLNLVQKTGMPDLFTNQAKLALFRTF